MREMGRPGMEALAIEKPSTTKKVAAATDRVVSGVLSNTVGRAARFAGRRLLGEIPETAKTGSFHPADGTEGTKSVGTSDETQSVHESSNVADLEGAELIEQAISEQLQKEKDHVALDTEDEALFRGLVEKKVEEKTAA